MIGLVNAGLEGFARATALEAPRGVRVNVVSPPWVTETLQALNLDPSPGKPAAEVAKGHIKSIEGQESGRSSKFSSSAPKPWTPILPVNVVQPIGCFDALEALVDEGELIPQTTRMEGRCP